MRKNITLLDGATGTRLWKLAEMHGVSKEPVWKYNIEHPEFVAQVCREYAEAGSQIIYTNTFGANGPAVQRSSGYSVREVVRAGVKTALEALKGTGVKTALDIGPLSMLMEPYGDLTEEEAAEIFSEQIGSGMDAGAELIVLETFMDLEMMKVAARIAKQYSVPVFCSMTFEKSGRTLMGNSVADIIAELTPLGIDAIGMNCSLGPDLALPIIREFSEKTDLPLLFKPNTGLPEIGADGRTVAAYSAEIFAADVAPALDLVTYLGCCCGSNADYIRALKKRIQ